jgi:hypothetical protein
LGFKSSPELSDKIRRKKRHNSHAASGRWKPVRQKKHHERASKEMRPSLLCHKVWEIGISQSKHLRRGRGVVS